VYFTAPDRTFQQFLANETHHTAAIIIWYPYSITNRPLSSAQASSLDRLVDLSMQGRRFGDGAMIREVKLSHGVGFGMGHRWPDFWMGSHGMQD